MTQVKQVQQEVVSFQKTDMDHLSEIAVGFIETIGAKTQLEKEKFKSEVAYREKVLIHEKSVFQYKFWLMVGGLVSIVSISAGLIFYAENANLGVSVLSHTGAIIGGVIAGVGYESGRKK